jgi:hypothetical protein
MDEERDPSRGRFLQWLQKTGGFSRLMELAVAFAAIASVWVAWYQGSLAREGNELAREALRARLSVTGIDPLELGDGNMPTTIKATIKNNGVATATSISARWSVQYINGAERPNLGGISDAGASVSVLAGGDEHAMVRAVPALNPARVERLQNRQAYLYFLGYVNYLDGVGQTRRLEFCNYYDPTNGFWNFCSEGNSAD